MNKINGLEIEFKYEIGGSRWKAIKRLLNKGKVERVEGEDRFYTNGLKDRFVRVRRSVGRAELTYKRKLEKSNNYMRKEYNIALQEPIDLDSVDNFLLEAGYKYDYAITKLCMIYKFKTHEVVMYSVIKEGKAGGIFCEIEVRQDYPWKSVRGATKELVKLEKKYKFKPKERIKKSLWELFR